MSELKYTLVTFCLLTFSGCASIAEKAFDSKSVGIPFASTDGAENVEILGQEPENTPDYMRPLPAYFGRFTRNAIAEHDAKTPFLQVSGNEPYASGPFSKVELEDWEKEDKRFDWTKLDPANFFKRVRDWMGMGPDEREANGYMKQAREIMLSNPDLKDKSKCDSAAKLFEKAAKKWPESVLEEDALYFAGECRFFADQYTKAQTNYESLIRKYSSTQHMNTAVRRLFSIARYWESLDKSSPSFVNFSDSSRPTLDTFGRMKKCYEAIFTNDPKGPFSDSAVMALAEAYMNKGVREGDSAYENAAFYYAYLRENYTNSKHLSKAYERELVARKMSYVGAFYDDKSLTKAGKLAEQTLMHFSDDPSVDRNTVRELSDDILTQKAEREWKYGQYYDKKREYGSARTYYNRIVADFPTTPFAQQASNRLAEIKDKPDEPRGFERWVNEKFPSKKYW